MKVLFDTSALVTAVVAAVTAASRASIPERPRTAGG